MQKINGLEIFYVVIYSGEGNAGDAGGGGGGYGD